MIGELLRKLAFALESSGVPYMLTGSQRGRLPKRCGTAACSTSSTFDVAGRWTSSEQQIADAAAVLRLQAHRLNLDYIENWVRDLQLEEQFATARAAAGERGRHEPAE